VLAAVWCTDTDVAANSFLWVLSQDWQQKNVSFWQNSRSHDMAAGRVLDRLHHCFNFWAFRQITTANNWPQWIYFRFLQQAEKLNSGYAPNPLLKHGISKVSKGQARISIKVFRKAVSARKILAIIIISKLLFLLV